MGRFVDEVISLVGEKSPMMTAMLLLIGSLRGSRATSACWRVKPGKTGMID
jgi:hypothetical protein